MQVRQCGYLYRVDESKLTDLSALSLKLLLFKHLFAKSFK